MLRSFPLILTALICACGTQGRADDRPLIWELTKTGKNSVQLRTGIEWPVETRPGVGVTTAVQADSNGAVTSVPVSIWSSLDLGGHSSPAAFSGASVAADFNAKTGAAEVEYSAERAWMANAGIDVFATHSLTLDRAPDSHGVLKATQAIKLALPAIAAAVSADISADTETFEPQAALGIEKDLPGNIDFTAKVIEATTQPVAQLQLAYATKW